MYHLRQGTIKQDLKLHHQCDQLSDGNQCLTCSYHLGTYCTLPQLTSFPEKVIKNKIKRHWPNMHLFVLSISLNPTY